LQGKTGPEVGRHIKALSFFFHGKNITPIPVTLEIKIKEVLTPFFGAFHGVWRTKSTGLC